MWITFLLQVIKIGHQNKKINNVKRELTVLKSMYTHRSYLALIDSFTSKGDKFNFNMYLDFNETVHRKIISKYCAHTAQFILNGGLDPLEYKLISKLNMGMIVNNMMEEK